MQLLDAEMSHELVIAISLSTLLSYSIFGKLYNKQPQKLVYI